jgi:N-acetylglucosaminyldiphosphoundecaprenol N-acetyl-beta-D-mannosaminyltransferase
MKISKDFSTANILGTNITVSTFDETLNWFKHQVESNNSIMMSAATVYLVMLCFTDSELQSCINNADYVMADGMPLVWISRIRGYQSERVHGNDFMLACCERFPQWRHFLLGGAVNQPELVAKQLKARIPEIEVAGVYATPERVLSSEESREIVEAIHKSNADLVWIGMGTPAQDIWMAENKAEVGIPLVGVGSAFDNLAGYTKPAPEWMKSSGLQWLNRLWQEPRRLSRRYLVYNSLFIWHLAWNAFNAFRHTNLHHREKDSCSNPQK